MSKSKRFMFIEERRPSDVLRYGFDEAPSSLLIKGNVSELQKLMKLIGEAIEWSREEGAKDGFSEDAIDGTHVSIEAYPDNRKIKPDVKQENPFLGWEG